MYLSHNCLNIFLRFGISSILPSEEERESWEPAIRMMIDENDDDSSLKQAKILVHCEAFYQRNSKQELRRLKTVLESVAYVVSLSLSYCHICLLSSLERTKVY